MSLLIPFLRVVRRKYGAPTQKEAIRDVLTDVAMFCDAHDLDFDALCQSAKTVAGELINV